MFTAFFRTNDKASRDLNANGHGLGLNICYNIAKMLGGGLSVESELGKGATFILDLETTYESILNSINANLNDSAD
jgi:signal transduction histidine kinase